MQVKGYNLSAADRAVIVAALLAGATEAENEAKDHAEAGDSAHAARARKWADHANRLADMFDTAAAVGLIPKLAEAQSLDVFERSIP